MVFKHSNRVVITLSCKGMELPISYIPLIVKLEYLMIIYMLLHSLHVHHFSSLKHFLKNLAAATFEMDCITVVGINK